LALLPHACSEDFPKTRSENKAQLKIRYYSISYVFGATDPCNELTNIFLPFATDLPIVEPD